MKQSNLLLFVYGEERVVMHILWFLAQQRPIRMSPARTLHTTNPREWLMTWSVRLHA